jgi:PAS domain S-box-containing protein
MGEKGPLPAAYSGVEHYLEVELYRLFREDPRIFQFIDQGSLDGVWYWDIEHPEHEWYSPRFAEVLGYRPGEIPNRSAWWQEHIHPDDLATALESFDRHRDDPSVPYDQVVRYRHRDGSTIWVRCRGLLIRDDRGNPVRMLGAHTDLTELRKAEDEGREHLEQLTHVSRLATMGEMAARMAHELNQPLGAITNRAFLGQQKLAGNDSAEAQEFREIFTTILEQAERAGKVVNHLGEFTKKARPLRSSISIDDLISPVVTLVEPEMKQRGVRLNVAAPSSLPRVSADRIQIQQVIFNLVRNAVESMEEIADGARELNISGSVNDESTVEVAVRDSGRGLAAEESEKLFDAFFTTKTAGMGMGLAISKSIVEAHGGRLWVENNQEAGTTFHLTLPIAQSDSAVEALAASASEDDAG